MRESIWNNINISSSNTNNSLSNNSEINRQSNSELQELNSDIFSDNSLSDWKIKFQEYIVKKWDYLSKIAKNNNTTVSKIQHLNHISNPNLIKVWQKLKIKVIEDVKQVYDKTDRVNIKTTIHGNEKIFKNANIVNLFDNTNSTNTWTIILKTNKPSLKK